LLVQSVLGVVQLLLGLRCLCSTAIQGLSLPVLPVRGNQLVPPYDLRCPFSLQLVLEQMASWLATVFELGSFVEREAAEETVGIRFLSSWTCNFLRPL
jgi:hypothetical protein